MKIPWNMAVVLVISTCALGQSPVTAPAACTRTISFAIAQGGQPVPAIPKFAAKWIGKKKNIDGYPELCLAQTPSSNTANYVVIFSTSDSSFDGLTPSAHTYTSTGPQSGNVAFTGSYGGTWNYSYLGVLPASTTNTIDLQRVDASKKMLVLRAYDQQGRQVSRYSVDSDHSREKLLQQVVADIHRDAAETPPRKRVAAPLSVYYVNCDVDSPTPASQVAATEPPVSHGRAQASSQLAPRWTWRRTPREQTSIWTAATSGKRHSPRRSLRESMWCSCASRSSARGREKSWS